MAATSIEGKPIVLGLRVSSFTNSEEAAVGLTAVMPFLLQTRLTELGARFEAAPDFTEHAVRSGHLVTGQNPQSTAAVATLLLAVMREHMPTLA